MRLRLPQHGRDHRPGGADPIPSDAEPAAEERVEGPSTSASSGSDFALEWAHLDGETILDYSDPFKPSVIAEGEYTLTLPICWVPDISGLGLPFTWKAYIFIDPDDVDGWVPASFSGMEMQNIGGLVREGVVTLSWQGWLDAGQVLSVFVHHDNYSANQAFVLGAAAGSGTIATIVKNGTGSGPRGRRGEAGEDGDDGADGANGVDGADGGVKYTYLTDTASSDPGSGKLKFDSATLSAITALRISETDGDANGVAGLLASLDDSSSTVRATVTMVKAGAPSNILVFQITGSLTDNGAWDGCTVAFVASSGSFSNNDVVRLFFSRTGDKGDTGATGATGSSGTGFSHSTVGTTAAGGSFDNPGAAAKWYYKKVTLSSAGLLSAILAQVKGDNTNGQALTAGLWDDNSGAVGKVIAIANGATRNAGNGNLEQGVLLNTTVRQIAFPIGKYLASGDYWLGVWLGSTVSNSLLIAYNSGTGSDKTQTTSANFFVDSPSTTGTSNDFSVAADIFS